jgi:hypothetical protein
MSPTSIGLHRLAVIARWWFMAVCLLRGLGHVCRPLKTVRAGGNPATSAKPSCSERRVRLALSSIARAEGPNDSPRGAKVARLSWDGPTSLRGAGSLSDRTRRRYASSPRRQARLTLIVQSIRTARYAAMSSPSKKSGAAIDARS